MQSGFKKRKLHPGQRHKQILHMIIQVTLLLLANQSALFQLLVVGTIISEQQKFYLLPVCAHNRKLFTLISGQLVSDEIETISV